MCAMDFRQLTQQQATTLVLNSSPGLCDPELAAHVEFMISHPVVNIAVFGTTVQRH